MTPLRRNILASYASQIYGMAVSILVLPLYLKYMGAEAYGLVGFFTMLQAWFFLLDMGLTPTVARETARFNGGAIDVMSYLRLLRALQLVFALVALIGGGVMVALAAPIAHAWLKVQNLPIAEVNRSLQLMGIGVALRWMSGLYRGCITGSERLVWLAVFNSCIATLRFLGVLPVLILVGASPTIFFTYQLAVAVIELAGLAVRSLRLIPPLPKGERLGWSLASLFLPIRSILKFAISVAFTSSVWVLITQSDKLILSGILPLSEYGYFALAVMVANAINVIASPVSGAILPNMTRLHTEGRQGELLIVYRHATRLVSTIVGPIALTLSFCAEKLLYSWTNNAVASSKAAPILALYAIGNGILAVAAFPYYLQYARGDLRYHLLGNIAMGVLLVPGIAFAASSFGGVGAGYAWVVINAIYLLGWVGYVHARLAPNLHLSWLARDVIGNNIAGACAALFLYKLDFAARGRVSMIIYVVGFAMTICAANLLFARICVRRGN